MVNDDNEKQKYLREFNNYFPPWNRDEGVIKEIKEDLERIKKITDLEKKFQEVMSIWKKHSNSKLNAKVCYIRGRLGESGISEFETLHRYDNFFQNLTDLKAEINLEIAKGRKKNNEDKRYFCLYCGIGLTEDEFVVKTCSKEECLRKLQAEISKKFKQNKLTTERERERERERESNFTTNQYQNNPTQELNNLKNKPNLNANEQARIKELERELKEKQVGQKENNYKLWLGIGCGVLGMSLVGLVVYLVRKKEK